jgi:hypothetical protein
MNELKDPLAVLFFIAVMGIATIVVLMILRALGLV